MGKVKDLIHPLKKLLDAEGYTIKCPKCKHEFVRIMGAGTTPVGINPKNLELECGNCRTKFYEFNAN